MNILKSHVYYFLFYLRNAMKVIESKFTIIIGVPSSPQQKGVLIALRDSPAVRNPD